MKQGKKIISILIKIAIGVACGLVVYDRLENDLTPANIEVIRQSAFSNSGALSIILCILMIPLNWGIESYKWKIITQPVEQISFLTAQKSVYSGICLGNLAPGRATEFLAKIIFFKYENRPAITVLHFINGMFQLSVTYIAGMVALVYKLKSFGDQYAWIAYVTTGIATVIIILFVFCIFKIDRVLHYVSGKIKKDHQVQDFRYKFTASVLVQLFGFSVIRYAVFFFQMVLLINLFEQGSFTPSILLSVALYFLITTTIPMISIIEPAIRAAVALVVFSPLDVSDTALALASVGIWLLNLILPSITGYFILLRQNFDFFKKVKNDA